METDKRHSYILGHGIVKVTRKDDANIVLLPNLGDVAAFSTDEKFVEFGVRLQFFAISAIRATVISDVS